MGSYSLQVESKIFFSLLLRKKGKSKPDSPLPLKIHFSNSDIYISNYIPTRGIPDNSGAHVTQRAKRVDFFRGTWNAEEKVFLMLYSCKPRPRAQNPSVTLNSSGRCLIVSLWSKTIDLIWFYFNLCLFFTVKIYLKLIQTTGQCLLPNVFA